MNTRVPIKETAAKPRNAVSFSAGRYADWVALLGRIGLAALFVWSGYGKLSDISHTVAYMNAHHLPLANGLVWPTALLELVGGLMLAVGWKARWAALALAVFSVVAALIFHDFWAVPPGQAVNQMINFMKNIAIAGGLLQVFAFGSGRLGIERL